MLYGRYNFSGILKRDAVLPSYKGSTFRGVFGLSLKRVVCALQRQDCLNCLLRERCVYPFIFEGVPIQRRDRARPRIAAPPHPYVIRPPLTPKTLIKKGEAFDFALLLFGRANDCLPYFIYAFERMGKTGIGRRINGSRAGFVLESVRANGRLVYSGESGRIATENVTEDLAAESFPASGSARSSLTLRFKTPLRLKHKNSYNASIPFHVLIRAGLRRISALFEYHGEGEPALDYKGLVKKAESIEIVESTLRWVDWRRYSNRQEREMLMGGVVGDVTYQGDLCRFISLLEFCEKTHIGKQTTFGLGQMEIISNRP